MPIPPYNANIPQPTDLPSNSQPQLLNNFGAIDQTIAVNHVGFNNADQGKHTFITFQEQPTDPTTPLSTEINVYTKDVSGTPQIFLQRSTGTPYGFTQFNVTGFQQGWTYLPSGILMAWGTDSIASGVATKTVTFSSALTGFPGFTASVPNIQLTRFNASTSANNFIFLSGLSMTDFVAAKSGGATSGINQFYWFAVGI